MTIELRDDGRYYVNGKKATKPEAWVAMALERLKLDYIFQATPFGARRLRGQYLVDFVVFVPFEQPLEHMEERWHTGALGAGDRMRIAQIERYYKRKLLMVWGKDTPDVEGTYRAVRKVLMR